MIKGIIALFSSGTILNPMVWIGILGGLFLSYRYSLEKIYGIFYDYNFYLIGMAIAFVYTFAFNQVYKGYSNVIDWPSTFKRFFSHSFMIILSTVLSAIFFSTLFF